MCLSGGSSTRALRQGQLGVQGRGVQTSRVAGYDLQKAGWYNEAGKLVDTQSKTNQGYKYGKGVKYGKSSRGIGRRIESVKEGTTRTKKVDDLSSANFSSTNNPLMPTQTTYAQKTVTQTYRDAAYIARMEANANERVKVDDGSQARRKSRVARSAVANANQQSRVSGKRSRSGVRISLSTGSSGVQIPGA